MSSGNLVPDAYNANFNPADIIVTYESAFSENTQVPFQEIQSFMSNKIMRSIIYSTRLGAGAIAMIILWMVTKNRKSPIFLINQFSLLFLVLHSVLFICYLRTSYASALYAFTYFPQLISRSDIYITGAVDMLEVLLFAAVETSLVFQVYVIFKSSENRKVSYVWIALSIALGLATVGMYFATAVVSMLNIYEDHYRRSDSRLFNVSNILLATSINVMTLLLSLKLYFAIRARKYLGLKQFDTFHILLVMSIQSLVVPSVIFILSYTLPAKYSMSNLVAIATLVVVLSLPLSSMWASASNNMSQVNTFDPNSSLKVTDTGSFYSQTIQSAMQGRRSARANQWERAADISPDSEETTNESASIFFKNMGTPSARKFTSSEIDDNQYWLNKQLELDTQTTISDMDIPLQHLSQMGAHDDMIHSKVISKNLEK